MGLLLDTTAAGGRLLRHSVTTAVTFVGRIHNRITYVLLKCQFRGAWKVFSKSMPHSGDLVPAVGK